MTSTGAPVPGLPPDGPCPDCEAPAGRWCYAWCPRFRDDPDDPGIASEHAQAGDHPDGF
jgi:hypothetical protein